jgi:chromate transporter
MVNLATYVGSVKAGLAGSFTATLAVVLPSFLIILLVTALLKTALKNPYFQAVLKGLKPCVTGIVLATGLYMVIHNVLPGNVDLPALCITAVLVAIMVLYPKITKKKLSPIALILCSAVLGILVF